MYRQSTKSENSESESTTSLNNRMSVGKDVYISLSCMLNPIQSQFTFTIDSGLDVGGKVRSGSQASLLSTQGKEISHNMHYMHYDMDTLSVQINPWSFKLMLLVKISKVYTYIKD